MKYLLHIDTSSDLGTIAISGDGELLAFRSSNQTRNHASTINQMISDVATDAKLPLSSIDAITVCAGPGSYTGLRIGLATAKGLCYAMDKPLLLDNRLTLLAYQNYKGHTHADTKYLSLLLAREREYFTSIYDENFICTSIPKLIGEEELQLILANDDKIEIITNVPEKTINDLNIRNLVVNYNTEINLSAWAVYAFEQFKSNQIVNLSSAEPFYLKQVYTHK